MHRGLETRNTRTYESHARSYERVEKRTERPLATYDRTMVKALPRATPLAARITALAPNEGLNTTRYPGVSLYNITASEAPTPTLYPSSLILVGSGQKEATLLDRTYRYDAGHFLLVPPPLPMLCRTIASKEVPVLTAQIEIDPALLHELLLEMGPSAPLSGAVGPGVLRAKVTPELEDVALRLLGCLDDERRTRVLARQTLRELFFIVLEGPHGHALRALAEGPTGRIAQVLRHLDARYAEHTSVADMAKMAHMSVPTFHQHFKAMTASSPLRYVKALRLARARAMLQRGGLVKTVARDVGYESESQFSREYRRFFGAPPSARARSDAEREPARPVPSAPSARTRGRERR